eukprot:CAMPEP_0168818572 /NCGR_PEP_ID=MMETSP0726-20121227/7826_1 /TAXON_ID=265536 /ORGANISM="Amphiprora sp., Strain CCMP467" /LENGTH=1812 /DNA_ID=CAMNT_0008870903 /DNA_START=15 /DNA_END=5453 /DNA_ORIENTATION=-
MTMTLQPNSAVDDANTGHDSEQADRTMDADPREAEEIRPEKSQTSNTILQLGGVISVCLAIGFSTWGRWVAQLGLEFILRVLAWSAGIALGLGWATHVYEQLDLWQTRQDEKERQKRMGSVPPTFATNQEMSSMSNASVPRLASINVGASASSMVGNRGRPATLEDEHSYVSLMSAAGYKRTAVLRGQVMKKDQEFWETKYPLVDGNVAKRTMRDLWGSALPTCVQESLSKWVEHILRDFVGSWYSMVDNGVPFKRASPGDSESKEKEPEKEKDPIAATADEQQASDATTSFSSINRERAFAQRAMIYATSKHVGIPFMDSLYDTMSMVFGNLATRMEHLNVFEVVLIKWTKVLAHTFKVYRQLRSHATHKLHGISRKASRERSSVSSSSARGLSTEENERYRDATSSEERKGTRRFDSDVPVSEMAMTKEFLLAGKLHKAMTFGLDVPSLLFADASGREYEINGSADTSQSPEKILERRLFETGLLRECELDYNRVVGNRMVKVLMNRENFGSPIVSALITEIMGSCVLTPVMNLFHPDFMNGWILMGLRAASSKEENSNDNKPKTEDSGSKTQQRAESVTPDSASVVAEKTLDDIMEEVQNGDKDNDESASHGMDLLAELAIAMSEMKRFMYFEQLRTSPASDSAEIVDWENLECRAAILRLVLVIEAALLDGRCVHRRILQGNAESMEDSENGDVLNYTNAAVESADDKGSGGLVNYESTLPQLLMELTGDVEEFEERVASDNSNAAGKDEFADLFKEDYETHPHKATTTERSTLRTLIAAWLHTGQIYHIATVIVQAHATILSPYYFKTAFLRSPEDASGFVRQLQALDQVEILVDTLEILNSPSLSRSAAASKVEESDLPNAELGMDHSEAGENIYDAAGEDVKQLVNIQQSHMLLSSAIPRHFDFHRNEAFSSSLRSERERRMQSWYAQFHDVSTEPNEGLCVARILDDPVHKELHQIARIFYSNTALLGIRDAARRNQSEIPTPTALVSGDQPPTPRDMDTLAEDDLLSLLTVETACPRRRIEVPDDDSSFLLRAQPRPLTAVGVHRDQRNHDQSFRCFAATYEEPALKTGSDHFGGGRYIRKCLLRYFPIDRTASILLQSDSRKVDQRRTTSSIPDTITLNSSGPTQRQAPFLSAEFLKNRHTCYRWNAKGTNRTQSLLASNVMEPTDFTAQPRTGKAIDFVYRMSLFEKPMLELSGKKFTVQDSGTLGQHRAAASALEISDAALSTALYMVGETHGNVDDGQVGSVQMGEDGYPTMWMKFTRRDDTQVEVKPYRLSFVRAALLVTSARQEAQLQSLVACVKVGSAKKATKALTDSRLKPTLRLLQHANHRSREKQSLLLRDLKLGINHVDREQLRRNGLLNPRSPTILETLTVSIEEAILAEESTEASFLGTTGTLYKIKCNAIVRFDPSDDDSEIGTDGYYGRSGNDALHVFKEEWIIFRSFKDFQVLHKHLKTIVSPAESSGNAVTRLSASLNAGHSGYRRLRGALVPSLSLAAKIGTLGLTKKSLQKRRDHLGAYLSHLFANGNPLSRTPECLMFVGAFHPLPPTVMPNTIVRGPDPIGRTMISVTAVDVKPCKNVSNQNETFETLESNDTNPPATENGPDGEEGVSLPRTKNTSKMYMIPSIRHKIDKVPLSQVRHRIFDLLRYQFGFDNASFMRNRMLAGLRTASFAVTTASEFRKILYKAHLQHLSASAVSGWIDRVLNIVWPNGVFLRGQPPLTPEQLVKQAEKSKSALHDAFPDAVRAILGHELTRDGLNIFHEMLQNRVVIRSMCYMLFDILWLEVFPEIGDVLQGGAVLDSES